MQVPLAYISSLVFTFFKHFVCLGVFTIFWLFFKVNSGIFLYNRVATPEMNPTRRTNLHSNVWSCHAFNVVHQLSSFCALCFAIFADEVVLLIFVLQTFSWNHSPIHFVCSPLSSLETFRNICVTLCCKKNTAR